MFTKSFLLCLKKADWVEKIPDLGRLYVEYVEKSYQLGVAPHSCLFEYRLSFDVCSGTVKGI